MKNEENKRVRVGVIGAGNIGSAHVAAIYGGKVPHMHLTCICDINAEKRASLQEKYPDIPIFDSDEAMFDAHLCDAVILSVPHFGHAPLAVAAFEKGYHVLTEKPGSVTASGVRTMTEAWRKSGKKFGVMFNQRTNPLFAECKSIMQAGEIGELRRMVWIITNWFRKDAYYASGAWRASWTGEGGGVLMNQAPHNLDLWQWICGMPDTVRADCPCGKFHDLEVEDEATVYGTYPNGATAVFITTTGDYPGTNRLEINGTKGKIVVESNRLKLTTATYDVRDFVGMPADAKNPVTVTEIPGEKYEGHANILENFARHILFGEELIAPGEDALNEVLLCNAAYLSAWTGKEVSFPMDEQLFDEMLAEKQKNSRRQIAGRTSGNEGENGYLDRWNTVW